MQKSDVVLGIAEKMPGVTRGTLRLLARLNLSSRVYDHWVVKRLVESLQCRIPVVARLGNGMKIEVHLGDHVGGAIIRSGYYEERTVRLIELLLKPGMVFVDVGTHVGQYTLLASGIVGAAGAVHSFEPDPDTFASFSSNVRRNSLANVHANHAAVAAKPGTLQLYLSNVLDIGSNSLQRPSNFSGRVCNVEAVTLDGYLQSHGVAGVDLMKVDVEGAEGEVFAGAAKLLGSDNRPVMIIEFEEARQLAFKSSCARLAKTLEQHGYDLFRLDEPDIGPYVPRQRDLPSVNVLAVPRNKLEVLDVVRQGLA